LWKKIAVAVALLFIVLILTALAAGSSAGVLKSTEPLMPVTPEEQEQDKQIANAWEDEMGLTGEERKEVKDRGVELSFGLLEAIRELTNYPAEESAKALYPADVRFEEMEKTIEVIGPDGKTVTKIKVMKLIQARTYNGLHVFKYEMKKTVIQSGETTTIITEPVCVGEDWKKDYSRINRLLKSLGFNTKEDRLLIYRQALAFDPEFGDPEAQDILLEETGGGYVPGTIPKGGPLPPDEITDAIREAIALTGVDESEWLLPMQRLVMHESGGNPYAYNPTPVWYSAKWGEQHAMGLCQVMPPTFMAHKLPGHDDIWDPVDNTIAAIRYIKSRYGDPDVALQRSLNGGY